MSRVYPPSLLEKKKNKQGISVLTAYDCLTAGLLDEAGIDVVLVGDSLGNTFAGHASTLPVTMDQMIYHTQAVARGVSRAMVLGDMPFLSYQLSAEEAKKNAGRFLKEAGAHAVKLEVGVEADFAAVQAVLDLGVPVMGHLGLTPQHVYRLGGYKRQGKSAEEAQRLLTWAQRLEAMGCFSVLVECIPDALAGDIRNALSVPLIGIGSGPDCDGQVLVTADLLGLNANAPAFVKPKANLRSTALEALRHFHGDLQS
ncbi:MAG: 3-methyl-2-oxobutanoate hydroxymethyltransferase [Candidatus Margulisiibacteriota bacterium]